MKNDKNILVTGAAGKLGRRVVELLLDKQPDKIFAMTRRPQELMSLADRGVIVRKGDFDDPDSLTGAFQGVQRMLIISTDAVGQPGKRAEQHRHAIEAAVKAGVEHIVYASLSHPEADSPVLIAPDHNDTEKVLSKSGVGYTILRNNLYTDLLLMSLPQAVKLGSIFAAAGKGGAAYITREDCAQAAAAALMAQFDLNRTLELTGPATIGYEELAAIASDVSGKQITYTPMSPDQLIGALVKNGMPEPIAALWVSFDVGADKGFFGPETTSFRDLVGREPTSVRSFLNEHRYAITGNFPASEVGRPPKEVL